MRIIGGQYRGKRLPEYPKDDIRPTTDFARESLFNLLATRLDIEDIRFADLFAGLGTISWELMSRGASGGHMVDISSSSHKYREKLKNEWDYRSLKNLRKDAFRFARTLEEQLDFVFADPPYDHPELDTLPDLVMQSDLLKADGLFVLEHPEEHTFGRHPHFVEHRKYGRVNFSFFRPLV